MTVPAERKLLVSDFDGTLLQNKRLAQSDLAAILRWRKAGHLFCIATGRSHASIRKAVEAWSIPFDYLICVNGAELYDQNNVLLQEITFSLEAALPVVARWSDVMDECIAIRGDSETTLCFPVADSAKAQRFTQIALHRKNPSDSIEHSALPCDTVETLLNGNWVNIVPGSVDKATAIEGLMATYLRGVGRIITVGDDLNDVEMIRRFSGYAIVGSKAHRQLGATHTNTCQGLADICLIDVMMHDH